MAVFNSNMEPNKKGHKYKGIKAGNKWPVVSTPSGSSVLPPGAQVSQRFGTIMVAWGLTREHASLFSLSLWKGYLRFHS